MEVLIDFLDLLRNGKWHDLEEVARKTGLAAQKIRLIINFFSKYHFIEFDERLKRIRASQSFLRFLKQISK
ncbi:hypothetical protein DRN86_04035 [Candidatus Geothermarchaeota archaeon]|nr:MAG: hypothetical protein DRN86_04035 [Candidatus Geothermarchaeota archaeon]